MKKFSRVTYSVGMGKDGVGRLTHINNTKRYRDRVVSVSAVCAVAEESGEISQTVEKSKVLDSECCVRYSQRDLDGVLAKCKECFDVRPGLCTIGVCEIETVPNALVVNQPPYQVPLKLKKLVDEELDKLIESEIIVPSDSNWASLLVATLF